MPQSAGGEGSCPPCSRDPEGGEIDRMQAGTEKKLAQIEYDYNARKEEINRRKPTGSVRTRKPAYPPEITDLPVSNRMHLKKPVPQTPSPGKKRETDVYREEAEAMRDYLKEYGTFQQQKLAIAEEYAEKIRKAQSPGRKA
ncbi:hypothetical protein [Phocaeicola vulgatus]|uniref:hypothetical protein n=1 Tax=Phocaeicola vulgatus TaxID=821 RepID=UPI003B974375